MPLLTKAYLGSTKLWEDKAWWEDYSPEAVINGAETTLTADATAHTKGAWTQLVASTSSDVSFLLFRFRGVATGGTNTATLVDIATGASGSETAIASNIAIGSAHSIVQTFGLMLGIPLKIPSGTRLSARIQSVVTGGKTAQCAVSGFQTSDYDLSPTSVDVIGSDTATSQGTSFSGSSGTWVEGTASTSQDYRAIGFVASAHDASIGSANPTFSIGVGAAGSEVIFGETFYTFNSSEQAGTVQPYLSFFARNIPAGSRLAVKHNISSNPEKYGFTLIGIP